MINTKTTNKDQQLKDINNLLKDESFLYLLKIQLSVSFLIVD